MARDVDEVNESAVTWAANLQAHGVSVSIIDGHSRVGGGSLPGTTLPTKLVAIETRDPQALAFRLRQGKIPVIGRIQADRLLLDPRTVLPFQVETLQALLLEACKEI